MSFKQKIILIIGLTSIVCLGIAISVSSIKFSRYGEEQLIKKSQAILSRLEAVRGYVASQGGLKDKISKVVAVTKDGIISEDLKLEVLKQVPIFASMKIGTADSEKEGYRFRVYSTEPRNKKNKADEKEMATLVRFENDPNLQEIITKTEDEIIVSRPVRLSESQGCLTCHGNPSQSPWGNGNDVLGYKMEDWKDGKLHGVFAIHSHLSPVKAETYAAIGSIVLWGLSGSVLALLLAFLMLNKPLTNLALLIHNIRASGEKLNSISGDLSITCQNISSATTESAASLEETNATTEEITMTIKMNTDHTVNAKNLATSCLQMAEVGKTEVENLNHAMSEISQTSQKIGDITTTIDDIAFQTNLLALNAAVEAARAGEHGKGFAVVADAVRSLAQKSSQSSKEINTLINESLDKIKLGTESAEKNSQKFIEIVTSIEKVVSTNNEISSASFEQSKGVENINLALNELDKSMQMNSKSIIELSDTSDTLAEQSQQMYHLVDELNDFLNGKNVSEASVPNNLVNIKEYFSKKAS